MQIRGPQPRPPKSGTLGGGALGVPSLQVIPIRSQV